MRLFLILKLYFATVCMFLLQKPLFMLYNAVAHPEVRLTDYLSVMWHALPLDLTVAGYVTVLPWLAIGASWFITPNNLRKFSLRQMLLSYYAVISFIMALVFVADTVLYPFWGFKIDSTVFIYTDKPGDALASVSTWFVAGCILAIVMLTACFITIYSFLIPKQRLKLPLTKWSSLLMLPVGGLLFLAIRGGVGEGTANVSNVYYSENQYLNHAAVNPAFNIIYSLLHQQDFAKEFRFMSEGEREEIVKDIYPGLEENICPEIEKDAGSGLKNTGAESGMKAKVELTDTLLSVERPNVLLIVWEGCGAKMVEAVGGKKNVTPNLARIASEGVLFTQCYSNSFRTDRGLVSLLSGWLGMPSASLMKIPNKCNNLPGIARSLHKAGYSTDFWYGGDISFTNMGGFMLANGFCTTHSDADFSHEERSYSKWGVMDGVLLDKLATAIAQRKQDCAHPWFTTVLTLSSHEPWEVPYARLQNNIENSFAYTDDCLGKFIDRLKRSDQWKNMLVVIVPDHGVIADNADTRSSLDVIHIPLIFTGGAMSVARRKVSTIMNQSDIPATLLAQLGVDHTEYPFSRNVFSPRYTYPSAIHTSPIDATFVDSAGITTYDFAGKCVSFSTNKKGNIRHVGNIKAILQTLYDKSAEL